MALREILARFGFQVDQRGLQKASKGIDGVVGKLQTFGTLIAGSIIVRGVKDFVTGMVDAGDALGKTATQLGLSSDQLQAWQAAAGFAGVESTKFNQSLRVLAKNANAAATGATGVSDKFKQLGVDVSDANGNLKSSDVLMREVGLALGKLENKTEAVALAQELMGRTGAALLPLFKDGAEGLDAALAALDRFGGGLSKDLIPLAEAAQDRFAEWDISILSLKSRVAVGLLPAISAMTVGLSRVVTAIAKFLGKGERLNAVLAVLAAILGKALVAKFGASLLALGRAAIVPLIKIALLVLLIDDLMTFFKGGDSLIGRGLDKIFGKGAGETVSKALRGIGGAISDLVGSGDFKKFDEQLEEIFGPPGQDIVADIVFTFSLISEALGEFTDEMGEGIDLILSDLGTFFSDIGSGIVAAAIGISNDAIELAESIIDGIIEGLKDGASAVVDAIVDVAKGAIDAAKGIFKPGSPSKVFLEMGIQNVEGLAMGMRRAASKATSAASAVSASVVGGARGLGGGGGLATAVGRGAGLGGRGAGPMAMFKSEIHLTVTGGSASDPQIQKLRQGVKSELRDNRRATLAALEQLAEVT